MRTIFDENAVSRWNAVYIVILLMMYFVGVGWSCECAGRFTVSLGARVASRVTGDCASLCNGGEEQTMFRVKRISVKHIEGFSRGKCHT